MKQNITTDAKKKVMLFRSLLVVFLGTIGIFLISLISVFTSRQTLVAVKNIIDSNKFANITATFSFISMGVLATVIPFILSRKGHPFVREYLTNQWGNFLTVYFTTISSLVITFAMSVILTMARVKSNTMIFVLLGNVVSNMFQLFIILFTFLNMLLKSKRKN